MVIEIAIAVEVFVVAIIEGTIVAILVEVSIRTIIGAIAKASTIMVTMGIMGSTFAEPAGVAQTVVTIMVVEEEAA